VTLAVESLEARDIRVHIRGVKAVDGVDLTLYQGEILGLIGPNGAGRRRS
jgi:ABC-type branched-subunit amino acid transport system ATPase component